MGEGGRGERGREVGMEGVGRREREGERKGVREGGAGALREGEGRRREGGRE